MYRLPGSASMSLNSLTYVLGGALSDAEDIVSAAEDRVLEQDAHTFIPDHNRKACGQASAQVRTN